MAALYGRADELAERLGKSRTEVYREAFAGYVFRRKARSVTSALDELVDEQRQDDPWVREAGRKVLERNDW